MKIVADENMPDLDLFRRVGRVVTLPGRELGARQVADAEVLLVRSVTPVNEALLAGSDVRWVGTATIGTDHLDLPWLAAAGITVANAPGCNAAAVAEYVLQAALCWSRMQGRPLARCRAGIIGLGNVGQRVAGLLEALGLEVLVSDPPRECRADVPEHGTWAPLSSVMACDLVSLHVPLLTAGRWPTRHLVSTEVLARLGAGQCLINTSRGAVLDNQALQARLAADRPPVTVLDVWEHEPTPVPSLVRAVDLATPHIAGYSVEGKRRGTAMLWQQFCAWQGTAADIEPVLAPPAEVTQGVETEPQLLELLRRRYDLAGDDAALRESLSAADPGAAFDALRRNHGPRHECAGMQVSGPVSARLAAVLERLGVLYRRPAVLSAGNTQ